MNPAGEEDFAADKLPAKANKAPASELTADH
jgi:hypothetical protein